MSAINYDCKKRSRKKSGTKTLKIRHKENGRWAQGNAAENCDESANGSQVERLSPSWRFWKQIGLKIVWQPFTDLLDDANLSPCKYVAFLECIPTGIS